METNLNKYIELTKPKVTFLNLLVGVTCFTLVGFPSVDMLRLAVFAFAGYLACGGCGVLNCVYDQSIDKLMQRTSKRAIPSGAITPKKALVYGLTLISTGIAISGLFLNALTAAMFILGAIFYLVIYTILLKRFSPWNVVIGGAAGCFAALSGWTATGATLTWMPILIAIIDFMWTPGHLWGLAIRKAAEYHMAGIPMLPVVVGISRASQIVFWLNITTVIFSLFLPLIGFAGSIYLTIAALAGAGFTVQSLKLLTAPSELQGFKVFSLSIPYLILLMIGLIIDKIAFI